MKIICISDTHHTKADRLEAFTKLIPAGDMIIHSGDATINGELQEVQPFLDWFAALPFKYRIFTPGNHDFLFQHKPALTKIMFEKMAEKYPGLHLLQDSGVEIEGIKMYGSPWQKWFYDWAFNLDKYDNGKQANQIWAAIPDDTEILITHGPPLGMLDSNDHKIWCGCPYLEKRIKELKKLKLHVFGHIHPSYGSIKVNGTTFINAASCTEQYKLTNPPIVFNNI